MEEKNIVEYIEKARTMLHDKKLDDGNYSSRLGIDKEKIRQIARSYAYSNSLSLQDIRAIDNMWKRYTFTKKRNEDFEREGLREPTLQTLEEASQIAIQKNYRDLKGMITYAKNRIGQGGYLCAAHLIHASRAIYRLQRDGEQREDLEKKVDLLMQKLNIFVKV